MIEKFGVKPNQEWCSIFSWRYIDNILGVPGIGVKTAAELINKYGDLGNLLKKHPKLNKKKRERLQK